jgi:hypothetical protein
LHAQQERAVPGSSHFHPSARRAIQSEKERKSRSAVRILPTENPCAVECIRNRAALKRFTPREKAHFVFDIDFKVSVVFPRKCNPALSNHADKRSRAQTKGGL